MKYWDRNVKIAYKRCKYIQNIIRERSVRFSAATEEERQESAATAMDNERTISKMTVFQYITYLKHHDPSKKKKESTNKKWRDKK